LKFVIFTTDRCSTGFICIKIPFTKCNLKRHFESTGKLKKTEKNPEIFSLFHSYSD